MSKEWQNYEWVMHNPDLNEYGEPRRTKASHPYSYDPITLFDSGGKPNATDYTDRLFQFDHEKYTRLREKHMPNTRWDNSPVASIEAFLRDYHGRPALKLCKVIEYCNQSNGYPVWRLDYFYEENAK